MIEHVVREWRNNKIEQRYYNNHELFRCWIKSGFACFNIRKQSKLFSKLYTIFVEHDWTVLLQGCWANNPVISCDIFTRVEKEKKISAVCQLKLTRKEKVLYVSIVF